MKKTLLTERFQQLAGIKPLYEQESNRDKYIAKAKELLGTAKMGTEALVDKIKASPEFQKFEAEVKKELQTGKITKAGISKAANAARTILNKSKEIASSQTDTSEKRTSLMKQFSQLTGLAGIGLIYDKVEDLINWVRPESIPVIPDSYIDSALILIAITITVNVSLFIYDKFANLSDTISGKDDSPKNEGLVENELIDNDTEEIIQSLLQNPE